MLTLQPSLSWLCELLMLPAVLRVGWLLSWLCELLMLPAVLCVGWLV